MSPDYDYILVVDDNAGVRRLLYELLSDEGYHVESAENGEQALRKVLERTPLLVLLDVKMPGLNGLETLAELRKIASEVPVAMITAYPELRIVLEARKSGLLQYYLEKPFDLDKVRNLVKSLLDATKERGKPLDPPAAHI